VVTSKRTPIASGDLAGALLGNGAHGTDVDVDELPDTTEQPAAAPAKAAAEMPSPVTSAQFKAPEDVRAAYQAGKLDRATATKILKEQFGLK
jgi:hypothetical protein